METWRYTFLRKTVFSSSPTYTNDEGEISSDEELGVKTAAMEVFHLRRQSDHALTGMVALFMLLPETINPFQRQQLETFSHFIATLIEAQGNMRRNLDEKSLAEQEAVLGRTLNQFRHSLRGRLGRLSTALDDARYEGATGEWLQRAQEILAEISRESDNARNFVKVVEIEDFDVQAIWVGVIAKLSDLAQQKDIALQSWTYPDSLTWRSDPGIVGMILEALVLNAVEQCRPGDSVKLEVQPSAKQLRLTVWDSGPGVVDSVLARLFTPGVTTKSGGTGFGLHFNRRRAHDLGGDLVFEKEYKPGAAFSLTLPKQLEA